MKENTEYIWYASYGSNILEERFLFYILGGKPIGSTKEYIGSKDKTFPIKNEEIYINSELYFAKKSSTWNGGGVCFININFDKQIQTLGRMYLITKEQFLDIVRQETGTENSLNFDIKDVMNNGFSIVKERSWYVKIIYLGNQDDYPIFTISSEINFDPTKPDKNYLKTIIRGLQETYNLNEEEIKDYLITKRGIINNYTSDELLSIIIDGNQAVGNS